MVLASPYFMSKPDFEKLSATALPVIGHINSSAQQTFYYSVMGSGFLMLSSLYPLTLTPFHLKTNTRPPGQQKNPTLDSTRSKSSVIMLLSFVGDTPNTLPEICTIYLYTIHRPISSQTLPHIDCYLILT